MFSKLGFCFRCTADEVSKGTDTNSTERATVEFNPDNSKGECHAEDSFSGKVSVTIADTGDTDVVVSMIGGNKWVSASSEKDILPLEVDGDPLTESCNLMSNTNNQNQGTEKTTMSPIREGEDLELSLSHNMSCNQTSKSLVHDDLKENDNGARSKLSSFDGTEILDVSHVKTSPSRTESDMGLYLGLSVGSILSGKLQITYC